ncbi:MAG: hypothetical protein B6D34_04800 [Candidatus Brocadia sp. UTAMX1]|jgi:hypothetical protein|nr:MAG: hypothetical protein B6D34_04800 [Candidatus Brocadia sp. UTAMX1]
MNEPINLLQYYLPSIYDALILSNKLLSDISNKYYERFKKIESDIKEKGEFNPEWTMFDFWWDANEGDRASRAFLEFINNTASEILQKVEGDPRKQIINLCHKMIINFNNSQSQFQSYVAELAVINKLIKNGRLALVQVEKILPNGKRFDFEVENDGNKTLVEVFNIKFDFNLIESTEKFQKLLEHRLTKKLNSKLNGLTGTYPPFLLIPVLWGNILELERFADAFSYFKEFNQFIYRFTMIAEFKNHAGEYLFMFDNVDDYLERARNTNKI